MTDLPGHSTAYARRNWSVLTKLEHRGELNFQNELLEMFLWFVEEMFIFLRIMIIKFRDATVHKFVSLAKNVATSMDLLCLLTWAVVVGVNVCQALLFPSSVRVCIDR